MKLDKAVQSAKNGAVGDGKIIRLILEWVHLVIHYIFVRRQFFLREEIRKREEISLQIWEEPYQKFYQTLSTPSLSAHKLRSIPPDETCI